MKINILFFFLFLSIKVFSQTNPILFSDEFDNNNNKWPTNNLLSAVMTTDDCTAEISNGKYHIHARKNSKNFHRPVPIDDSKDYSFEIPFIADFPFNSVEMVFYSFYGAQLGFVFYGDNSYSIYTIKNNITTPINQSANAARCFPNSLTIALKRKVTMKIERQGIHTSFYINDIKLETIDNLPLPGNKAGFTVGSSSKVTLERFTIRQDNNGINLTKQNNNGIKRALLGTNVNSTVPDLGPIITADGKNLYFNRRDRYDNPAAQNNECDDIWVSPLQADSSWGPAQKLPFPINDAANSDFISMSPDNNTLFMSDKSCDPTPNIKFWTSHRTTTGWSNPTPMNVTNGYDLDKYTEVTLSADGKTIIIALRRDDTMGEPDLYVCFLGKDSVWSEPENIGKTLNTLGQDFAPFLASDGVTLYYSTDGLPGFGDQDVFMTRRLDDTWTNWSMPENLGSNVNSPYWDAYYSVNASGTYAFVDSHESENTLEDIYQIKLFGNNTPNPVVVMEGKVLNSKTNTPVEAMISYEILPEGKDAGLARSNPSTGEYKIILPYGNTYGYRAEAKGYISVNEHFDLTDPKQYQEITKDLFLIPIEVGEALKLNNVFFVQSKAEMLSSSYPELDRLIKIMKDNPTMEIELRGYTDNQGDPRKDIELSQQRVNAVKNYMITKSISGKRIQGKGFGGANPIADNSKEETRKLNRRVEFVIVKK
jgi:outer membrane protein OmpA-like peptidoglycan-associated protein